MTAQISAMPPPWAVPVAALAQPAGVTLDALVARVYADTPAQLHPVARRSLHAHLIKLARDGRAVEREGRWLPLPT
jgi:hypothetical protein